MSRKVKLTLGIPEDVVIEAKKKIPNISKFVTEQLQMEIYRDNPSFIHEKIEDLDKKHDHSKDLLMAQLKIAEEKQHLKKDRLGTSIPEVMDYRTRKPKKKGGT